MVKRRLIPVWALAAIIVASCASVGDAFLVSAMPASEKAAALARTALALYKDDVLVRGDLSALEKARKHFEAALRYDPTNADAVRYLAVLDEYRNKEFSKSITSARTLSAKRSRGEEEEYQLHAAIRRASLLAPDSGEAQSMLKDTAAARLVLVDSYLARVERSTASITPAMSDSAREKIYIEAFRLAMRARELEPSYSRANRTYRALRDQIAEVVERRLGTLPGLYAKGAFEDARGQLGLLDELNRKIGGEFSDRILAARYECYYKWAQWHEGRKEWALAITRANSALGIRRSTEAQALLKRVSERRDAEERGASFDAGLRNVDAFLAKGDVLSAQRVIVSLAKTAASDSQRAQLDDRRKKIRTALAGIYQNGVQAYREERFKDAIALLETVVGVDPAYEQAADFLEKARAKQAVLDQY
ncbi:MAG TPA: hypothetical protein PLC54_00115 [Spirochaetales bacterium]|nr:hypothetical protein [Spirochaetales bacterium]